MTLPSSRGVFALLVLCTGCSGKEGTEVPITQTPVVRAEDSGTADSGTAADSGLPEEPAEPDGPFWMVTTLTGGDPARAREGQRHMLSSGTAQLTEDPTGFVLSLRFEGEAEGVAIVAPCVVPLSFTGGLPAENAETGGGGYDVGCPKLSLDGVLFADNPNGLTTITVNDGATIHGSFQLDARSEAGHLLVADGTIHAELCDGFWDGSLCTW